MVELPEWLGNLSSLHELIISDCFGLMVLPECVQKLTALEKLEINDNDALQKWCRNQNRNSWIQCSHIKSKVTFSHARKTFQRNFCN
jgi:hypothetical protein